MGYFHSILRRYQHRMITLHDIQSRQYLKEQQIQIEQVHDLHYIESIDEARGTFYENNTIHKIHNWQSTNVDSNVAFTNALEAFNMMLLYATPSHILHEADYLISEIFKVRNSTQLQNSLKYQKSKVKTKLKTTHNQALTPAQKTSQIIGVARPTNSKGHKEDESELEGDKIKRESLIESCYDCLLSKAQIAHECDRIVENYDKINKRYNLDNIFRECVLNYNDVYGAIQETVERIDTFKTPFKNRFNTALECCWYGLNKKHISQQYSNPFIVESVIDYYIFGGGIDESMADDIIHVSSISPIFEEADFNCIDYLIESKGKKRKKSTKDNSGHDGVKWELRATASNQEVQSLVGTYGAVPDFTSEASLEDIIQTNLVVSSKANEDKIDKLMKDFKTQSSEYQIKDSDNEDDESVTFVVALKGLIASLTNNPPLVWLFVKKFNFFSIIRSKAILHIDSITEALIDMVKAFASCKPVHTDQFQTFAEYIQSERGFVKSKIFSMNGQVSAEIIKQFKLYDKTLEDCKKLLEDRITKDRNASDFKDTKDVKSEDKVATEDTIEPDISDIINGGVQTKPKKTINNPLLVVDPLLSSDTNRSAISEVK